MKIYTIGFTKKSAEDFFESLSRSGTTRLVDVRLHNVSQLAGFAKRNDLEYFLRKLCGIEYAHDLDLAPTGEMLDSYRKLDRSWPRYEVRFLELMRFRQIETTKSPDDLADATLLCSEASPNRCHRRLVAEYLHRAWGDVEIVHL